MSVYIDLFPDTSYSTSIWHNLNQMSTAIVSVHLPEGFVIGADGRRRDTDSRTITTDTAQKIFSVKIGKLKLVYAWSGGTVYEMRDGTVLDFKNVSDAILKSIDMPSVNSFSDFVQLFNEGFYGAILPFGAALVGSNVSQKKEIARVLFVGYFYDQPCKAEIAINCGYRVISKPEITQLCAPATFGLRIFSGSEAAHRIFSLNIDGTLSLLDAAARVRDYIRLCFIHRDPPLDCENPIGGHIHIGKLTPEGFSWIDSPI